MELRVTDKELSCVCNDFLVAKQCKKKHSNLHCTAVYKYCYNRHIIILGESNFLKLI